MGRICKSGKASRRVVLIYREQVVLARVNRSKLDTPSRRELFNQQGEINMSSESACESGIGMGAALAMILSYTKWHSIIWAILHGICSWIYVIYYAIKY